MKNYKKNNKGLWLPFDVVIETCNQNEIPSTRKFLLDFMDAIPKITALLTVIGIFVGNFNIYKYLNHINFGFLFPDIIGNSSSAIAVIINYILFITIVSLGYLSPFLINYFAYIVFNIDKKSEINILIAHILSIGFLIFNIVFFFIGLYCNIEYGYFIYFLSFVFVTITLRGYLYLHKSGDGFIVFIFPFLVILPYCIYFLFSLIITIKTLEKDNIQWIFFGLNIFIFIFNHFMAMIQFKSENKIVFIFLSILTSVSYYIYLVPFQNYNVSLHKPKFIEKYQDSSWYLIHNGNTVSETINGMNSGDIENKKRIFNNKDCKDDWCEDDVSMILEQRKNALYGYMAWNLGDTKVFCPASVDFFDGGDNNQEKSKKCLVIDGKYLQLVSEELLLKD